MVFRIGPWVYRVKITDQTLYDDLGRKTDALCVSSERTIWIAASATSSRRVEALVHECRHAWRIHLGAPTAAEADCQNVASFATDVMRQFYRQGGEQALARLNTDGVIDHGAPDADVATSDVGCECPACGTLYRPGQIKTTATAFDAGLARLVVDRSCECDFCGKTFRWREAATTGGLPSGRVVSGPTFDGVKS